MSFLTAQLHPGCYPSDPGKALEFFREALALDVKIPPAPAGSGLAGIVAPHLGPFQLGLATYVAAFRTLLDEPLAETYLILGVGHRSHLEWNLDRRDYVTPFGRATCATEIVDALAADTDPKRLFSSDGHQGEHSIEFPLIWLQALHRLHRAANDKPVRFVPILCGGLHHYVDGAAEWDDLAGFHRLAKSLADVFAKFPPGEKLRVIVSIDGCHMGPRFQHPFRVTPQVLKATAAWENLLWTAAATGDVRKFVDWFREQGNDRYFDGVGALALLMAATAKNPVAIQRTHHEQWFTARDASVVTLSSGRVLSRG